MCLVLHGEHEGLINRLITLGMRLVLLVLCWLLDCALVVGRVLLALLLPFDVVLVGGMAGIHAAVGVGAWWLLAVAWVLQCSDLLVCCWHCHCCSAGAVLTGVVDDVVCVQQ